MKQKKEEGNRIYFYLGMFFMLLQVLVITRNGTDYLNFIWFCNFAPLLFAFAFFLKNTQFIKALINVALIPDILFLIDFFSSWLFNFGIFGQVQPYFQENFIYIATTVLLHIPAFLALALTYKIKPKIKTLIYSAYLVIAIYLVTLLFSPSTSYYNYIYSTRPGYIHPNIPYMIITLLWPLIVFLALVLPAQAIQFWINKKCLKQNTP